MTSYAYADARGDAPNHPTPTTEREQDQRHRQLVPHPGALHPIINAVVGDARLRPEFGAASQLQIAMQLPPRIVPKAAAVAEEIVARWLALCPVADVVLAHHADRPRHADQGSEFDKHVFKPERAFEAVVNETPGHADRVAAAKRDGA